MSLDLRKAFDVLPHRVILKSLEEVGVPDHLSNVIKSWLSERVQRVRIGSTMSKPYKTPSGVPQGSVLGPLLFVFALRRLTSLPVSAATLVACFADDTVVVRRTQSLDDTRVLQNDVALVSSAISEAGMACHPEKCKVITFGCNEEHQRLLQPLLLDNVPLDEVDQLRWLGITVTSRLGNEPFWRRMATTAKRTVASLAYRLSGCSAALPYAVETWATSLFLFAVIASPPTTAAGWRKLDGFFVYASRHITGDWASRDSADLLRQAGQPTAAALYYRLAASFLFQCMQGQRHFGDLLRLDLPSTELRRSSRLASTRTGNARVLLTPADRNPHLQDVFRRLGCSLLPALWNALPLPDPACAIAIGDPIPSPLRSARRFKTALPQLLHDARLPDCPLQLTIC